jgi:inhibitor of KinA
MAEKPTNHLLPPESAVQLFPLGDSAVVLQFGDSISPATHGAIQAFSSHLTQQPFAGLRELVPAFTTLTVYYDPWLVSQNGQYWPYPRVVEILRQQLAEKREVPTHEADTFDIPVWYGGAYGPDLDYVAEHAQLTVADVIACHSAPTYLVHMIGFAPGFPYLGGLDERLATPRKTQPRALVPPGSVGIAGPQTGIYSLPTPGGWQLIGRTPLQLFNPNWMQPSLLQAGQHVRFVPIDEAAYNRLTQHN